MNKLNNTTYKVETIKNAELDRLGEPKDLLEVEIGDAKQAEFFPQVKLMRWNNEANFSVRLSENELGKDSFQLKDDKVLWDKGNLKAEFYEADNAFKFVWYLKAKPASNKVQFTIQSKDVDFFYQPPLTEEKLEEGQTADETHIYDKDGNVIAHRPENVVGSYAVYSKSSGGMNDKDGKDYKVGKVGHIYRPHLYDAEGKETWGILNIENGIYSVEIPQEFLDTATYPIKSNDTFGYESAGGSNQNLAYTYNSMGGRQNRPGRIGAYFSMPEAGDVTKLTIYTSGDESISVKGAINEKDSEGADSHGELVLGGETTMGTSASWKDINITDTNISNGTDLILNALGDARDFSAYDKYYYLKYDSGATDYDCYELAAEWPPADDFYTSPESPWVIGGNYSSVTNNDFKYSIYATYTPSGGTDYSLTLTETIGMVDSSSKSSAFSQIFSGVLTLADNISKLFKSVIKKTGVISLADTLTAKLGSSLTKSDTISVDDDIKRSQGFKIKLKER